MKSLINKYLVFVVLLLVGIMLVGCKKSSGKIELRIGFWPENTETKDIAMYQAWKEAFEADYPEYEIIPDHYTYDTSTVGSKYLTGTLPTVFETWFTEPIKLVKNKYIRSIDSQLKELGWDTIIDPDMKETLTFDGKIYGIPRDGYGLGLVINLKTFVENGLLEEDSVGNAILYDATGKPLYPTTFEQIYEASLVIAENTETKGILICSANKNGGWQFSNIAWNYGAELEIVESNGKIKANLDCDEAVNALRWIQKMKQEELLLNSPSVTYDQWYNAIGEKVAMAIVGSDVLQLAQTQGGIDMKDLAFVPMPTGDGIHYYSLYGGTPFVFSSEATDEQVMGDLKFFEYSLVYLSNTPLLEVRKILFNSQADFVIRNLLRKAFIPKNMFPAVFSALNIIRETHYNCSPNAKKTFVHKVIERILSVSNTDEELNENDIKYLISKIS